MSYFGSHRAACVTAVASASLTSTKGCCVSHHHTAHTGVHGYNAGSRNSEFRHQNAGRNLLILSKNQNTVISSMERSEARLWLVLPKKVTSLIWNSGCYIFLHTANGLDVIDRLTDSNSA